MHRFLLQRLEDETGVSGTGLVAEGIQFSNGKCALTWLTEASSVAVYDNIDLVEKIHGHNGKTIIVWIDKLALNAYKNVVATTKDHEIYA